MDEKTKRVFLIMEDKNMNAAAFAKAIGVSNGALSHIKKRNAPGTYILTKITNRFKDINSEWLLTGKGTMKKAPEGATDLFGDNQTNPKPGKKPENEKESTKLLTSVNELDFVNKSQELEKQTQENIPEVRNIIVEKEVTVYKERPVKTIEKLVIFFSDKTYETFIPEN